MSLKSCNACRDCGRRSRIDHDLGVIIPVVAPKRSVKDVVYTRFVAKRLSNENARYDDPRVVDDELRRLRTGDRLGDVGADRCATPYDDTGSRARARAA